jgi:hypothetical protein
MMFFFSVRVDHSGVSFDELWDEWEKEVDAAQAALEAGKIKNLYKVSGRRRVVGVLDVDSHEGANGGASGLVVQPGARAAEPVSTAESRS